MALLPKKEINAIKDSIDFSKYPPKSLFPKRSGWILTQMNIEAYALDITYGRYSELLYMGKVKRPKEALYTEVFLYDNPSEISQKITAIYRMID